MVTIGTGDKSSIGIPLSAKQPNRSVVVGKEVEEIVGGGATTPPNMSSDVCFRLICFLNQTIIYTPVTITFTFVYQLVYLIMASKV